MRMHFACAAAFLLLFAPEAAPAAGRDFKALTRAVEAEFGVNRQHIPLLGFASFVARVSSVNTVRGIDIASFEGLRYSEGRAHRFSQVVSEVLDGSWSPMVRVRSRRSGEWTGIYVKRDAGSLSMMVTTLERDEASIVQLKLSPDQLLGWLRDPERAGECGAALAGSDSCHD